MNSWLIETLVASSVLMLAVLALRGAVAQRFGAQAAYLLWLLPALRMILPPLVMPKAAPITPIPVQIDLRTLLEQAEAGQGAETMAAPAIETVVAPVSWSATLLILWLAGAAVFLAWQLGRYHRFMTLARAFAGQPHRRRGVSIRLSSAVPGPIAAGLIHRTIFLPTDFADRYDRSERRLVLAHELAHHRRGDLIANMVALVMLSLHWFNPIAHLAYRAFRADQELACDATVVAQAREGRRAYGSALLKSAVPSIDRERALAVACGLGPAAEMLKLRMRFIGTPYSRVRRAVGTALSGATVFAGLSLTASGCFQAPAKAIETVARPAAKPEAAHAAECTNSEHAHEAKVARRAEVRTAASRKRTIAVPPVPNIVVPQAPAAPLPPVPPVPSLAPQPPEPPLPPDYSAEAVAARRAARARAVNVVDGTAIARAVHAQIRSDLARTCTHAAPAVAGESDGAAIARLSAGCVDRDAIRREVRESLRRARISLDHHDIDREVRASIAQSFHDAADQLDRDLR